MWCSNHYNEDEDGLLARQQSAEYNETQMMEEKIVFILNSNQWMRFVSSSSSWNRLVPVQCLECLSSTRRYVMHPRQDWLRKRSRRDWLIHSLLC